MSDTTTGKLILGCSGSSQWNSCPGKRFSTYEKANEYSELLRKNINLDNDETGVFEINLESIPS